MGYQYRQIVENVNDFVSSDKLSLARHTLAMQKPSDFKAEFVKRVKAARERAGLTQESIARKIQTPKRAYEKYEIRSFLPHRLIEPFCAVTGIHHRVTFYRPEDEGDSAASRSAPYPKGGRTPPCLRVVR